MDVRSGRARSCLLISASCLGDDWPAVDGEDEED